MTKVVELPVADDVVIANSFEFAVDLTDAVTDVEYFDYQYSAEAKYRILQI